MAEILGVNKPSEKFSFKIRISNVVAVVNFHMAIDLDYITSKFKDVHKREKFPGIIISNTHPKATILLFKSGKGIFTGLEHPDTVQIWTIVLIKKLAKINILFDQDPEIRITNIVAYGNFNRNIDLDSVIIHLPNTIYEPEVFPGVIYKMYQQSTSVLLFSNGKFVLTGASSMGNLQEAAKNLALNLRKSHCFYQHFLVNNTDPSFCQESPDQLF